MDWRRIRHSHQGSRRPTNKLRMRALNPVPHSWQSDALIPPTISPANDASPNIDYKPSPTTHQLSQHSLPNITYHTITYHTSPTKPSPNTPSPNTRQTITYQTSATTHHLPHIAYHSSNHHLPNITYPTMTYHTSPTAPSPIKSHGPNIPHPTIIYHTIT